MSNLIRFPATFDRPRRGDLPANTLAEIKTLPYTVTRRAHARKPRRSKNGTPEERAAKSAAGEPMSGVEIAMWYEALPYAAQLILSECFRPLTKDAQP
ncbi:hypothetical protein ACVILK_000907 [Bradyrhizobium embrapense]